MKTKSKVYILSGLLIVAWALVLPCYLYAQQQGYKCTKWYYLNVLKDNTDVQVARNAGISVSQLKKLNPRGICFMGCVRPKACVAQQKIAQKKEELIRMKIISKNGILCGVNYKGRTTYIACDSWVKVGWTYSVYVVNGVPMKVSSKS